MKNDANEATGRCASARVTNLKPSHSHTCGSLFAKCACAAAPRSLFHTYSHPESYASSPPPVEDLSKLLLQQRRHLLKKRSSSPNLGADLPLPVKVDGNKRFSNPEVLACAKPHVCLVPRRFSTPKAVISNNSPSTLYKTNVYLNHPEINFPIPVEIPADLNDPPSLLSKNQTIKIDRFRVRKATLSEPVDSTICNDQKAAEFLQNFGIFSPMGNGVCTPIRPFKTSLDDGTIKQIKKNSAVVLELTKKNSNDTRIFIDTDGSGGDMEKLRKENEIIHNKYRDVYNELLELQLKMKNKEGEIVKLQREVHKLKSVLQQTRVHQDGSILSSLQEEHSLPNSINSRVPLSHGTTYINYTKKQGVSAESSETTNQASEIPITKYEKDFRSKQLIKDAIMDNDFLKNLDVGQVREMVDSMYQKDCIAGSFVIRENEAGAHLYVSAEGNFEILQNVKVLGHMGAGKAFGELAILYNCKRTASIKAVVDSKVWVLDRKVFQQIMVRTGLQRMEDNIKFLRSVPLLKNLSREVLAKIADALEVEFYPAGVYILRQGTRGDTFYIISSGSVKVTQRAPGQMEETEIRTLERGNYFGEQALLKEDCRTASVISLHPGVECLTLDTESFKHLIGDLSEIKEKTYNDDVRILENIKEKEYDYIGLNDLEVVATLGVGAFGRVELVQYIKDQSLTFALKCMKKQHIVDSKQERHVFSERNIMISCNSPFIIRLFKTYKDAKYVYMLLEACLGGEVWTILRDRGCFDETTTRFITACVIEAFDYLHSRGIIYRDLKPENLLLDERGYVKLVDFGFSKNLGYTGKTWTFCGTPEYIAPETILNKGHDRAVDYWALGIFMHELLTGNPPFTANDPMSVYQLILKGIDMIDFTRHNVGRSAQSLIKKLCRELPAERLGYQKGGIQDLKKHRYEPFMVLFSIDYLGCFNKTIIVGEPTMLNRDLLQRHKDLCKGL